MELSVLEIRTKMAKATGYTEKEGVWSKPPDKHGTVVSGPLERIVPNWPEDQDKAIQFCRDNVKESERVLYMTELGKVQAKNIPEDKQGDSFTKQWLKINALASERCLAWLYMRKLITEPAPLKEVA